MATLHITTESANWCAANSYADQWVTQMEQISMRQKISCAHVHNTIRISVCGQTNDKKMSNAVSFSHYMTFGWGQQCFLIATSMGEPDRCHGASRQQGPSEISISSTWAEGCYRRQPWPSLPMTGKLAMTTVSMARLQFQKEVSLALCSVTWKRLTSPKFIAYVQFNCFNRRLGQVRAAAKFINYWCSTAYNNTQKLTATLHSHRIEFYQKNYYHQQVNLI